MENIKASTSLNQAASSYPLNKTQPSAQQANPEKKAAR